MYSMAARSVRHSIHDLEVRGNMFESDPGTAAWYP